MDGSSSRFSRTNKTRKADTDRKNGESGKKKKPINEEQTMGDGGDRALYDRIDKEGGRQADGWMVGMDGWNERK
jgi:hypothetical protein